MVVKERQPVLEAVEALAGADRAIERVVAGIAAERGGVAGAEAPDGFVVEQHFAHRRERDAGQRAGGALGVGIEGADRFELTAEEIEAERRFHAGGVEIDEAAAHGVFAGFAHRRDAQIAVERGPFDELVAVDDLAGLAAKHMPATTSRGGSFWISALTVVRTMAPRVAGSASAESVVIRAAMVTPLGETRS